MSDFGDPDACESIGGFRYVGVQYPTGQLGFCVPRECDAENLNELLKMGKGLTGASRRRSCPVASASEWVPAAGS